MVIFGRQYVKYGKSCNTKVKQASYAITNTFSSMKTIFLSLVTIALFFQTDLISQEYTIDASHSAVLMKVQRFGVVNVVGRFGDVSGTLQYDPTDFSKTKIDISVSVDSYTANNPGGEKSAKSQAFLDSANHPTLSFTLTKTMEKDGKPYVVGDLTVHGVTKEVEFPVAFIGPAMDLPTRKLSIALSCIIIMNRLDFGVGPDRTLPDGTEIIGNRVQIELEILGIAN